MKTVKQVSRLTGISVRALHYYDEIGLLKPSDITEAGYRLYDDTALERLQSILFFRELEFPLKDIREIMESPDFDRKAVLREQKKLLELRRDRLDRLISLTRKIIEREETDMDFFVFDKKEIEEYTREAQERWGKTEAYKESRLKREKQTLVEREVSEMGLMEKFRYMGKIKNLDPDSQEVRKAVQNLKDIITENYYNCTADILKGLGQMYVCDSRMKENIDRAGGPGTAEFVSEAIEFYCRGDV